MILTLVRGIVVPPVEPFDGRVYALPMAEAIDPAVEERRRATLHLRRHLVGDATTTGLGVAVAVIASIALGLGDWWVWCLIVLLLVMGAVRLAAVVPLRSGSLRLAVGLIAAGSWGVSLGVVVVAPSFLPVLIITIVIPAVVAALFLSGRDVAVVAVALVAVTIASGSIGMWSNGVDIEEQIGESWRNAFVVGYLAGQVVPLVQLVWQTSRWQRVTLGHAQRLNRELAESEQALVESRTRLVEASDAERVRIERDLHDGAQQTLVSTLLQLRVSARGAERGRVVDAPRLDQLADELERGIDELRTLAHGIFPPLLDARGLFDAVGSLARTSAVDASVVGDDPGRLARPQEAAFYFCVSEALQNVAKHAGAGARAVIRFESAADGELRLTVTDDGVGPTPERLGAGHGIASLRDRMGAIGGDADVRSGPNGGCVVELTAPITPTGHAIVHDVAPPVARPGGAQTPTPTVSTSGGGAS